MNTELEKVFGYLNDASQLLSAGELEQAFAQLMAASSLLDCISNDCQSASSTLQRSSTVINRSRESNSYSPSGAGNGRLTSVCRTRGMLALTEHGSDGKSKWAHLRSMQWNRSARRT